MPAKLIACSCMRCGGSGNVGCTRCHGAGYVEWGECWGCSGEKVVICTACHGNGGGQIRTWIPDSLDETLEQVKMVEEMIQGGDNAWIVINSLRRGFRFSSPAD